MRESPLKCSYSVVRNGDDWSVMIAEEILGASALIGVRETEAEAWALVRFLQVADDEEAHDEPRKYQS